MNVIKSVITCCDCDKILEKPILLPCGQSACLRHVENSPNNTYDCVFCGHDHLINRENLVVHKGIETLIKANFDKIKFSYHYKRAYDYCEQLNKTIDNLEVIKKDPVNFVNETIGKLKNQTDVLREEFKLFIDNEANKIIDQLTDYERECTSKTETTEFKMDTEKIENDLIKAKQDVRDWKDILNDFDSTEEKFTTIKKNGRASLINFKLKTCNIKRELLTNNLMQHYDSIEKFSQIVKCFDKEHNPLDSLRYLRQFFEVSSPFEQSKIVNETLLQKNLVNLCEFGSNRKFTLVYRASEHGFGANDFHSKCDDVPNTLTIIKSTEGNIFGGFVDVAWDSSNQPNISENAFIFSLVNKKEQPFMVRIDPEMEEFAIYCHESYGPIFGGTNDWNTEDILISNNSNQNKESNCNFSNAYVHENYKYGSEEAKSILAGSMNFTVSEIEVYKLEDCDFD